MATSLENALAFKRQPHCGRSLRREGRAIPDWNVAQGLKLLSVVYRSRHLLVKVAHRASAACVVTFDSYADTNDLDRRAFGEAFFAQNRISAIHVVNGRNRWYHEPDWREAIDAVRKAASGYARLVTYGSSMGAYAALRFADHVGASTALALSPQYSRDPRKAPFEDRWPGQRRGKWLPELSGPLSAKVPVVLAYDPAMTSERLHAERIASEMVVERLALPHAGHAMAAHLSECGLLSDLVLEVIRGSADLTALGRRARTRRKQSQHYLIALSHAAHRAKRDEVALAIARRAAEIAPDRNLGWHSLGYLLSKLQKHGEALAAHHKAAELAPNVAAVQLRFAAAQQDSGDYDGALRTLRSLSDKPTTPEVRRKLATMAFHIRVLRGVGRVRAALRSR
ncbi:hypothetical protein SAMN05216304_103480 [Bosea sp. OK403]|nr:hypothetical protein SAMN05216304_103480 [Bosea sp. OK403]